MLFGLSSSCLKKKILDGECEHFVYSQPIMAVGSEVFIPGSVMGLYSKLLYLLATTLLCKFLYPEF